MKYTFPVRLEFSVSLWLANYAYAVNFAVRPRMKRPFHYANSEDSGFCIGPFDVRLTHYLPNE